MQDQSISQFLLPRLSEIDLGFSNQEEAFNDDEQKILNGKNCSSSMLDYENFDLSFDNEQ